MKRREFLAGFLSTVPAVALNGSPFSGESHGSDVEAMLDLIVVDGGFAGCLAALKVARDGKRVLLVESRTYLGREMTATLRPWLHNRGIEKTSGEIRSLFQGDEELSQRGKHAPDDELTVPVGFLKKGLVHLLRESGVGILFMSEVAGTLIHDDRVVGIVIGNKSGLQAIFAKAVIDASENSSVVRMAGARMTTRSRGRTAKRVIEFFSISEPERKSIEIPPELGLAENKVLLHPGKKERGHIYVEFLLGVASDGTGFRERMRWEIEARRKTILLCEYLTKHEPSFKQAVLLQTSDELWFPRFDSIDGIPCCSDERIVEMERRRNLFVLNSRLYLPETPSGNDFCALESAAERLGKVIGSRTADVFDPAEVENTLFSMGKKKIPLGALNPKPLHDRRYHLTYYSLNHPNAQDLPLMDDCNVLVVGGGTSGAPATISASRCIEKVTTIENFSGLGGTGTLGGINRYYHGFRGGFTAELDGKVKRMTKRISADSHGPDWNVEAKMMTYLSEILANNGAVFFRTKAVGTLVERDCVKGIVALNPGGLGVIRSRVTIDATGDGDIAVWAGGKSLTGDPRGGNLQTFNQCDWVWRKVLAGVNIDLGVVDITDFLDTSRGILIGHENAGRYDFSPFLSVRESRHIEGDYRLREEDILTCRRFVDTIAIGRTDYDQHGLQGSLLARMGFFPYHRDEKEVRIPYRVCLPKGIEGLLVTGKAFSAGSDAFCFMRMQPDLQNMGYAVGLAAAVAVEGNNSPRAIDISEVQKELIRQGIIRSDDIASSATVRPSPRMLAASLRAGEERSLLPAVCSAREEILPFLEEAHAGAIENGRLYLAMVLAWFGSRKGTEDLLRTLTDLVDEPQCSRVDSSQRPLGGIVGEPSTYWRVNQLIVLLGLAGDARAIPTLCQIAAETDAGGPHRPHARLHWRRIPNYDRIISLCFSLERFGDSGAVPALETLLAKPHLRGYVVKNGIDGTKNYTSAYLEVAIARTLARCGGRLGCRILADYVDDVRTVLASHAYRELKEISGEDFGKSGRRWKHWIERNRWLI